MSQISLIPLNQHTLLLRSAPPVRMRKRCMRKKAERTRESISPWLVEKAARAAFCVRVLVRRSDACRMYRHAFVYAHTASFHSLSGESATPTRPKFPDIPKSGTRRFFASRPSFTETFPAKRTRRPAAQDARLASPARAARISGAFAPRISSFCLFMLSRYQDFNGGIISSSLCFASKIKAFRRHISILYY